MAIAFECNIETQAEYRIGEPIMVTGNLRNTGDAGVWVLVWNTFVEGMHSNFVRVTCEGILVRYDGVFRRRGDPAKESYVLIPPGESVSGSVDLSVAYPIDEPGDYHESFLLHVADAFEAGVVEPPHALAEHERVVVSSTSAMLHVVAGAQPLPTKGERARRRSAEAESPATGTGEAGQTNPPKPKIIGNLSSDQIQAIYTAHNWGYASIIKSIADLAPQSVNTNNYYYYWFGSYDAGRAQTVAYNFGQMEQWMSSQPITYDCTDPDNYCTSDTYAYTYVGGNTIYICSLYFSWWWSSPEEQAQTVVHEASHAAAGIDDIYYGQWACAYLALTNPARAIDNADNYGYFALDVYPGPAPSSNGVWTKNKSCRESTNARPTAAASTSAGSLLMAYQDKYSRDWLWFCSWNVAQNSWQGPKTIYNPETQQNCVTTVTPAMAALDGTFYCVYVDGDPKSPYYTDLVYTWTADAGQHWAQPQTVVAAAVTTLSPTLAAFVDGNLYRVYVDGSGALNCVTGTPNANGVSWSAPTPMGHASSIEPGLGVYNGQLYCMYTCGDNGLRFTSSSDGSSWAAEEWLPDNRASAGIALVQWNAINTTTPTTLMCVYRGVEPDRNLCYMTYDGTEWDMEFRESSNASSEGPALAAYGTTLYEFNKGAGSSTIYWSDSTSPLDDD